uniref:Uncharacterized protein n=1 Tax=Anguilla anguilla TaxID=7936 RepID=A0A0E9QM07_ANGAN
MCTFIFLNIFLAFMFIHSFNESFILHFFILHRKVNLDESLNAMKTMWSSLWGTGLQIYLEPSHI